MNATGGRRRRRRRLSAAHRQPRRCRRPLAGVSVLRASLIAHRRGSQGPAAALLGRRAGAPCFPRLAGAWGACRLLPLFSLVRTTRGIVCGGWRRQAIKSWRAQRPAGCAVQSGKACNWRWGRDRRAWRRPSGPMQVQARRRASCKLHFKSGTAASRPQPRPPSISSSHAQAARSLPCSGALRRCAGRRRGHAAAAARQPAKGGSARPLARGLPTGAAQAVERAAGGPGPRPHHRDGRTGS